MAGLGFKDFQVGEVLTSSDVDGYLMQQAVMRFADAGARGSALGTAPGTAVALAEGMVTYLQDVNQVQVFNGAEWTSPGRIGQVLQTTLTSTFAVASSAFVDVTGLDVTITPSSASSKVLVVAQVSYSYTAGAGRTAYFRLDGGNASAYVGDAASSRIRTLATTGPSQQATLVTQTGVFLDAPATTSATTYKVQVAGSSGFSSVYINRTGTDSNNSSFGRGVSSITVFEVTE